MMRRELLAGVHFGFDTCSVLGGRTILLRMSVGSSDKAAPAIRRSAASSPKATGADV